MSKVEYKTFGGLTKHEMLARADAHEGEAFEMNAYDELMARLESVDQKLIVLDAKMKTESGDWRQQPRRLSNGQIVPLGDPRGTSLANRGAPGVIHDRGSHTYSLAKLFRAINEKNEKYATLEVDVSRKLERWFPTSTGGFHVPLGSDLLYRVPGHEVEIEDFCSQMKGYFPSEPIDPDERQWLMQKMSKAMSPVDEATGGSLMPYPTLGELSPLLRAATFSGRCGARQVPISATSALAIPRAMSDAAWEFVGPGGSVTASTPGTGVAILTAKKAMGRVIAARELLLYGGSVAESMLRESFVEGAARVIDTAVLTGSGGTLQPLGILHYARSSPGVPTPDKVTAHTAATPGGTGDTFGPADPSLMLGLVDEAPDLQGATAFLLRPMFWRKLTTLRSDGGGGAGTGPFLYWISASDVARGVPDQLQGTPVLTTTLIPKDRTKGGGTGLTTVICGNFRHLVIGMVGTVEVAMSDQVAFASDELVYRAIAKFDCQLLRPEGIVVCDSLIQP